MTLFTGTIFAPGTPLDGTHFCKNRPPDFELVDLIEQAFLEGQIDSERVELAYLWLMGLAPKRRDLRNFHTGYYLTIT